MRLILTEDQMKVLEAILNEVSAPSMSSKIEKGGFIQIVYLVGDAEKSQTFEITEVHGSGGRYITGTNKGVNFIIDTSSSLNTTDNTFILKKDGEYTSGSDDEPVISGSNMKLKNITQVNISDSGKNVVDKIYTKLGDKNKNSADDDEDSQEDLDKKAAEQKEADRREKELYDEFINDPLVRKAFHHQKTLFGGLLNYGKARGIGPAKALLSKYVSGYGVESQEDKNKNGKSKFKIGKKVKYKIGNSGINIQYGTETFMLPSGGVFKAKYNSQGDLDGKSEMDNKSYFYQIENIKNVQGDIYKGDMTVEFKGEHSGVIDRSQEIKFIIIKYDIN